MSFEQAQRQIKIREARIRLRDANVSDIPDERCRRLVNEARVYLEDVERSFEKEAIRNGTEHGDASAGQADASDPKAKQRRNTGNQSKCVQKDDRGGKRPNRRRAQTTRPGGKPK